MTAVQTMDQWRRSERERLWPDGNGLDLAQWMITAQERIMSVERPAWFVYCPVRGVWYDPGAEEDA